MPVLERCTQRLEELGIEYEIEVRSAHRDPQGVSEYAGTARERGLKVVVCAAGMAAHLAGAVAARTSLPVIGIPVAAGPLGGLDSLLSTVQMPSGVPVATVAVNGATNAAVLAAQILALSDPDIAEKADFTTQRIKEIEKETNHDVIAFVTAVSETVAEKGAADVARHFHFGLTSSDVLDTAGALQLKEALGLIREEAESLAILLCEMALAHRGTVMVGRTHGVHAEPTTLGHKLAVWAFEMERNLERLDHAEEVASVGKISGAVGTYANVDPKVEVLTCEELGLKPAPASTQVVQRDRHAEVLSALAILGSTLEKVALEIRGAQRTEVRELAEPFGRGQKGSSAMPHKRNPILAERLCGMARL